jgi:transcriptional regulator with XRE-family HTH domain
MLTGMSGAQARRDDVPRFELRHRMALALEFGGVSRDEIAAELDVHKNTITNYVKGHTPPPRAVLRVWALRTGVPFEWLLTGHISDEGGPGQGTSVARCIRGPWVLDATAVDTVAA